MKLTLLTVLDLTSKFTIDDNIIKTIIINIDIITNINVNIAIIFINFSTYSTSLMDLITDHTFNTY